MKRLLSVFVTVPIFMLLASPSFAQETEVTDADPVQITTEEEVIEETIENDSVYVIYVHAQCPHCQDVERFVAENNLESQVIYKELLNNDENYEELVSIFESENVPSGDQGWPFLLLNGESFDYIVGGQPIIDFLAEGFNVEASEGAGGSTSSSDESSTNVLFAVGGIVLLGVLGYGIYSILDTKES